MGSGDCFRSFISIKRAKDDRSKQAKVHSALEKPNGSKSKDQSHNESSSSSNDRPIENLDHVPPVPVEEDISATRTQAATQIQAATRIQTTFRAYMVRKKWCNLKKGTVRHQSTIQIQTVPQQASTALSHIHLWSRIQDQIRARRLRMVTEGRLRQKKSENQLKFEAKLHELEVEWCGGSDTMEEILCRIRQREEAAIKRERAMAYAFSHQWRANSSHYLGQASYSLGKENWGWSWMERWIAARPWEIRVHSNSADSNKVQAKQSTLNKVANQPEKKISVSVKPASSNEKGTTKAKDLVQPNTEKSAV